MGSRENAAFLAAMSVAGAGGAEAAKHHQPASKDSAHHEMAPAKNYLELMDDAGITSARADRIGKQKGINKEFQAEAGKLTLILREIMKPEAIKVWINTPDAAEIIKRLEAESPGDNEQILLAFEKLPKGEALKLFDEVFPHDNEARREAIVTLRRVTLGAEIASWAEPLLEKSPYVGGKGRPVKNSPSKRYSLK